MPRTIKLTWQPGGDGRSGRWRKKYKGKVHYFEGGRGKSDRVAYEAALKCWELEKLKIDAAAPRPHEQEHQAAISIWDQVLTWSKRHGDPGMAQLAFEKQQRLTELLKAPVLQSLSDGDQFRSLFEPAVIELPDDLFKITVPLTVDDFRCQQFVPSNPAKRNEFARELDGTSLRIEQEIWQDRLASQQRRAAIRSNALEERIEDFLRQKEQEAGRGELTIGRYSALRLHLMHFLDWIGKDASITDINSQLLQDYHRQLMELTQRETRRSTSATKSEAKLKWTRTTARHYLTTVKSFVFWLWETESLAELPRVLGSKSKSLRITPEQTIPITLSDEEVNLLIQNATGRTKLFLLLMLNCGMTQKDVADLRKSEIDLAAGRIIRKRSKTDRFESVPTVNYLLWPETLRLLREFVDQGESDRALLNENGMPLWVEQISDKGTYRKSDNIKNAFDRLKKKTKITKSLKSLKKTSSSKLRDNERFNGLEDLFLGHAPQKMSDKHYAAVPQTLLDAALCWLATQFGLTAPT